MADVTLTQDTLLSEIVDQLDIDGDTINLNGHKLTIDVSTPVQVDLNGARGSFLYVNNQSDTDFIIVNTSTPYYGTAENYDFKVDGKLINIGTVDANKQLDVSTLLANTGMPYVDVVYNATKGIWLYNAKYYGDQTTLIDAKKQQQIIFTYDDTNKVVNFDYWPVDEGDVIQMPNIIFHRAWDDSSTYNRVYHGMSPHKEIFELDAVFFWGSVYHTSTMQNIDIRKTHQAYIKNSPIRTGDTGYKYYKNMYYENCGWYGRDYSNGVLRINQATDNVFYKCTFYPGFRDNGGNYNNTFDSCTIVCRHDAFFTFFQEGTVFKNNLMVRTWDNITVSGYKGVKFENNTIKSSADPNETWYKGFRFLGYSGERVEIYGGSINGYMAYIASTYYGYTQLFICDFTVDHTGFPNNQSNFMYPGDNNEIHVINMEVIPDPNDDTLNNWGRFSSGFNYSENDWLIGYRGKGVGSLDSAYILVLDFAPEGKDLTDVGYYGSYFGTHYRQSNSRWEIRFRQDSFYRSNIIEKSPGTYSNGDIRFSNVGDYVIIDMTNGYNFMYYEIDEFLDGWYLESSYNTSNLQIEISLDKGKTWFDIDELAGKKAPKPFTMWLKVTAINSNNGNLKFLNIPFKRKADFVKYPSYPLWHKITLNQLTHTESLNCVLYTELEGRMEEFTTSNGTGHTYYNYHRTDEEYNIKARKYGYEITDNKTLATDDNEVVISYIGKQKDDITMTETDAAAVSGVVLQASSDTDYTWELDCGGNSLEDVYHYVQYKLTNFGEWAGNHTFDYNDFLVRDGEAFKTVQIRDGEGVKLINYSGKITKFQKDDGSYYVLPVTVTFEITGLVEGTEVRIFKQSDMTELAGVENSGTSFGYNYEWTEDIPIYVHIINPEYEFIRIDTTLTNKDQSIPVTQRKDRWYYNPQ